jgi:Phage integrase, N-terminal SAM-like domain
MGKHRDRMAEDLAVRGMSANTCENYLRYARRFVAHHGRSADQWGTEDARRWLLFLLQEKQLAPATVNVAIASLRSLFLSLGRPEVMQSIPYVRNLHRRAFQDDREISVRHLMTQQILQTLQLAVHRSPRRELNLVSARAKRSHRRNAHRWRLELERTSIRVTHLAVLRAGERGCGDGNRLRSSHRRWFRWSSIGVIRIAIDRHCDKRLP